MLLAHFLLDCYVIFQRKNFVLLCLNGCHYAEFLMSHSYMYMVLLIDNVLHLDDLNVLLQVAVVINELALSKLCDQNFHGILQYEFSNFVTLQLLAQ